MEDRFKIDALLASHLTFKAENGAIRTIKISRVLGLLYLNLWYYYEECEGKTSIIPWKVLGSTLDNASVYKLKKLMNLLEHIGILKVDVYDECVEINQIHDYREVGVRFFNECIDKQKSVQ